MEATESHELPYYYYNVNVRMCASKSGRRRGGAFRPAERRGGGLAQPPPTCWQTVPQDERQDLERDLHDAVTAPRIKVSRCTFISMPATRAQTRGRPSSCHCGASEELR